MSAYSYGHSRTAVSDEISLYKTLILSVLLHLLLLLTLGHAIKALDEAMAEKAKAEEEQQDRDVTFVFVDTPEQAQESPVKQVSPYFSDKNLAASNQSAPDKMALGQPYQEGQTEVPNMSSPRTQPPGQPQPQAPQQQQQPQPQPQPPQPEPQRTPQDNQPQPVEGGQSKQYDAMRELEALSKLTPPKKEQQFLPPSSPSGPSGGPSEPESPRFNNRDSRAQYGAGFSLSTYNWNWAPYLKELKKKIESNIYPPPAFYMGLARGRTFLRFKIMPDGTIKDFELIGYSGHESLKNTSVKAIESSLPFLPLPSDFPEEFLELRVGFYYNENIQ